MKNYKALFIIFLISTYTISAQDWTLKLSSNVELRTWKLTSKADKEERPLGGADIKLYKGTNIVSQVSSDANGDFTVLVPPNGDFILEVSYAGCNTKKFSVSTNDVPESIGKDNFKPTFSIGGFVMAKPFPGINYSGLQQALVKVEYKSRKKAFDHDDNVTNGGLSTVSKIAAEENVLIEKFCSTNKLGDIALAKPDCPLAKTLYEKAIALIPGEQYPVEQLAKVGLCLKEKEEAAKKAEEKNLADKIAKEKATADKAEADKLAKEKAAADKNETDKLAKEKEANDKLAKEKAVVDKAEADKLAKEKAAADKNETDKLAKEKEANDKLAKEKAAADKAESDKLAKEKAAAGKNEADKAAKEKIAADRAAREKLIAERVEKEKALAGKVIVPKEQKGIDPAEKEAAAKKAIKEKAAKEKAAKEKEGLEKSRAEDIAAEKAEYEKKQARLAKEEENKKLSYETKSSEGTDEMDKGNSNHKIPQVLGVNKYKEAIVKADDYFKTKRYNEAKIKYEDALKIKADDIYANTKLKEIEKILNTK